MRIRVCAGTASATMVAGLAAILASLFVTTPLTATAEPTSTTIQPANSGIPGITLTPPRMRNPRDYLTQTDELAALEAVHIALSRVADGATYVWRRDHGRLNAVIRPTQSFKDKRQRVCRHIVIMLNSGSYSRKAEGIACRLDNGLWSLEG